MAEMTDITDDDGKAHPGACFHLNKQILDAIGLDYSTLPDPGDFVHFTGLARVVSAHKRLSEGYNEESGGMERSGETDCEIRVELVGFGLEDESHEEIEMHTAGEKLMGALYGND